MKRKQGARLHSCGDAFHVMSVSASCDTPCRHPAAGRFPFSDLFKVLLSALCHDETAADR